MANWKKQIGIHNKMGRGHSKEADVALVKQRKAENIARLVEQIKERRNV